METLLYSEQNKLERGKFMKKRCRDPNLNYEDLWIPFKYYRDPVKDPLSLFQIFN